MVFDKNHIFYFIDHCVLLLNCGNSGGFFPAYGNRCKGGICLTQKYLYDAKKSFCLDGKRYHYYSLKALEIAGFRNISRLPYSIKILLESVLRQYDGKTIKKNMSMPLPGGVHRKQRILKFPLNRPGFFCKISPGFLRWLTWLL